MKKFKTKINRKTVAAFAVIAVLLVASCFILNHGYEYFMKRAYPIQYEKIVAQQAAANGLEPSFVYAVIKAESNFTPDAVSHAGAIGLMQLTPETFEWLQTKLKSDQKYTTEDLKTPEVNIRYGCKFLSILLEKYSARGTALSAYNAGIGTVNTWLKDPNVSEDGKTLVHIPYAETRKYVSAVLDNYDKYKSLYQFSSKGEIING